jgi:hypothetical protein
MFDRFALRPWLGVVLFCGTSVSASEEFAPPPFPPPTPMQVTNGLVTLRLDPEDPTLGMALTSIGDAADPTAYALTRTALWQLVVRDPAVPDSEFVLQPDSSLGVSFHFDAHKLPGQYWTDQGLPVPQSNYSGPWWTDPDLSGVLLRWWNVEHPALPGGGKYDVVVTLAAHPGKPYVSFGIEIESKGGALGQTLLQRFPRVQVAAGATPVNERLAIPFWQGNLFHNPVNNPELVFASQLNLPPEIHPGPLNMQWLAYYDEQDPSEKLLYWGSRDATGHPKGFRIEPRPSDPQPALGLSIEHVPAGNGGAGIDHRTPYVFMLGVLRGDWYDAARFYREDWALLQPGPAKGTMLENQDFSQTVRDADLFALIPMAGCPVQPPGCAATGLGQPDRANWVFAAQHLQEIQSYFGTQDTVFHLYDWDHNSFTGRWGDWFPLAPQFLQNFVPAAAAAGLIWAPYFHAGVLDVSTLTYVDSDVPGFEGRNAVDFTRMDEDLVATVEPLLYCPRIPPCNPATVAVATGTAILDEGSPFVAAYSSYIASEIHLRTFGGSSGLYMDVTQAPAQVSYNPAPAQEGAHPVGGGDYWITGRHNTLLSVRETMRDELGVPEYFVLGEAPCEALIGDIEFTYGYHGGFRAFDGFRSVVPLFNAVYHDYQRTGSILSLDVTPDTPFIFDARIWMAARQIFAANLFIGHAPYATSRVSQFTFSIRSNPAFFPVLARHLSMARDYVRLLSLDDVRERVVFGQWLRPPQTTAGDVFVQRLPVNDLNPIAQTQPAVYAAVFGAPEQDATLGLLLMNWTDVADPTTALNGQPLFQSGVLPGPQTLDVTIDREDYGLPAGQYRVREVVAPSGAIVDYGTGLDLSGTADALTVTVPGRAARFFLIDPAPLP